MCAGYANDLQNRRGYISVVAVLPEYSNKGYGKVAVQGFLKKAKARECWKYICMRIQKIVQHYICMKSWAFLNGILLMNRDRKINI